MPRHLIALLALLAGLAAFPASAPFAQDAPVAGEPFPGWASRLADTHLDFRHYYPLDEVERTVDLFAARFPELVTNVEVIGHSVHGRPLRAVTLHNPATGPAESKPAMYIDSNIHGNEIQGTEIILLTIWHLLRNYGVVDRYTNLVDTRTFYFVPVVNPDSRYHWFADPNTPHSLRHNWRPVDDDRDGQFDEDAAEDLDGDGRILWMRKRDPDGGWVPGNDPRVMERRRAGEPGEYRLWRTEGVDNDGDGEINEDGPGGVDLNRNFPSGWKPPYQQYASGPYPCSEPEVRACVDFILAHPNIAGMQFYHNAARMILRPPGSSPDAGVVPHEDIGVYDRLGGHGEHLLPGYRYLQTFEGLYAAHGTQIDFGYLGLGRYVFTNELWGRTGIDLDHNGRINQEEMVAWADAFAPDEAFIDWQPFDHPELGAIEIGGWDQFATRVPPADLFIEEGFRNALFTLFHAESFAELEFGAVSAEPLGNGLWRVKLVLRNTALMPTDSRKAVERREDQPIEVHVQGGEALGAMQSGDPHSPTRLQGGTYVGLRIARLPGESSRYAEIVVRASAGSELTLTATHPRAVDARITLTLP